ncbi:septum formation initiator family protein [Nakamurella sp. YIM 132087]|uniref:Septum formation initiator family protein n=1 Tax=Nakamurella alba TaxID=2665158 RepID=A0A7K1FF97_9ACTN|nr:septum formation initiator family protein [Nakamurella alba]MTD12782.1 septum formation initiator family protein [Nakamurella alba]
MSRPVSGRPGSAPAGSTAARRAVRGPAAGGVAEAPRPTRSRVARQAAALGLVLCTVALLIAFPLRTYLAQRDQLRSEQAEEQALRDQLADLQGQAAALQDPDYIKAEARARLQYVMPGDTVYVVQAPEPTVAGSPGTAVVEESSPWYSDLYDTLSTPTG